jgi:hypothetical protein
VDAETLAAVLNSTLFAAERFAGVKALGREAANDVEVFTARQFRVPDVRRLPREVRLELQQAFRRLRQREAKSLLEDTLLEAGLHEARVYVDQNPVSEGIWPAELRDEDRQRIDELLLHAIGVPAGQVRRERTAIYNELVTFVRRARLLELEAQINRRGKSTSGPTPQQLADDLWAELAASHATTPRHLPAAFIPEGTPVESVNLPLGQVAVDEGDLFTRGRNNALRFGRGTVVNFASAKQRDLALLLAENRVRGEVEVPRAPAACAEVSAAMRTYLDDVLPKLRAAAGEITENCELQDKILNEATKRLLPRH